MPVNSRAALWQKNASRVKRQVKFQNVSANFQFVLPGNAVLVGHAVVFNNNATTTQAAVTVGTGAAGTQFSAGASVTALNTGFQPITLVQPLRTDRAVYVESAAWQTGVHLVFTYEELPPVPSTSALS